MNLSDVMPIDEAQIHLLFEEAGLLQAEDVTPVPDMRRIDAVIERAMHETVIKNTASFVFKGFPAVMTEMVSAATGCVGDRDTDYKV